MRLSAGSFCAFVIPPLLLSYIFLALDLDSVALIDINLVGQNSTGHNALKGEKKKELTSFYHFRQFHFKGLCSAPFCFIVDYKNKSCLSVVKDCAYD